MIAQSLQQTLSSFTITLDPPVCLSFLICLILSNTPQPPYAYLKKAVKSDQVMLGFFMAILQTILLAGVEKYLFFFNY
jgi:hypothetical protein